MKYLFMCLISILFFTLSYASAPTEFTPLDIVGLIILITIILSLQVGICYLISGNNIIKNILLTIFTLLNIISLNLILNSSLLSAPLYIWVIIPLVGSFIIFTMMKIIDETNKGRKWLIGILGISLISVLAKPFFLVGGIIFDIPSEGKTSAKNVKLVSFKEKPNVYMVSFDALVPQSLLKKHMEIESVAYHEILNKNFRRFSNFFADAVPTKRSLNRLLALDNQYYSDAKKRRVKYEFFRGNRPSPLFQIFSYNGYTTNTIFAGNYFGHNKGPFVDNYTAQKLGFCQFIDEELHLITFFGYCYISNRNFYNETLKNINMGYTSFDTLDPIELLLKKMHDGLSQNKPQIVVSYIYSPGHTSKKFNHMNKGELENYKKIYIDSSKKTASDIQQLIDFINNEDPDAILYIFGDHGLWLSRKYKFKENKDFFVQDRFGIYGGIYPPDRCAESFSMPYTDKFMTISQGAYMIIRCLAGGEDAFMEQDIYRLPKPVTEEENKYESYLYE